MKIALITTHDLIENTRIEEEIRALGHEFELVNLKNFEYTIDEKGLNVPGITDLKTDIAFFRGVFVSLKAISAVAEQLKRRGIKVFDNNLLTHQYSINKITDIVRLANRGVPVPKTYYARDFSDYMKVAKEFGYPVVVKLTRTGKGAGVYKFDNETALANKIAESELYGYSAAGFLMQEFIPYVHDLRILVIGGKMYTMKRIPGEGEFRANFSLGGKVEIFKPDLETKDLALEAMRAVELKVGGVDVLITKDNKKCILEVNHTPGFVGMEEATKENITKKYVELVIEKAS